MGMRHVPSAAWGGSVTGGRWREARRKRDGGPELVSGAPAALGPLSSPVGIRFGFEGCPGSALRSDPGLILSQLKRALKRARNGRPCPLASSVGSGRSKSKRQNEESETRNGSRGKASLPTAASGSFAATPSALVVGAKVALRHDATKIAIRGRRSERRYRSHGRHGPDDAAGREAAPQAGR